MLKEMSSEQPVRIIWRLTQMAMSSAKCCLTERLLTLRVKSSAKSMKTERLSMLKEMSSAMLENHLGLNARLVCRKLGCRLKKKR